MRTLNLGILAHVDAGKTTLTERLLFAAGAIDRVGTVDSGTTQTDSLELERERGITIRSAVAAFVVGDLAVNIVDTPGHPDFIAEVERALRVLDGAIVVISAVEGIQPQTPLLFRALQRLRVPTLLFLNKVDRAGADPERQVGEIRRRLSSSIVPMTRVTNVGSRDANVEPVSMGDASYRLAVIERLAEHDDAILRQYVDEPSRLSESRLLSALGDQTRRCLVHPVFMGSAWDGTGIQALLDRLGSLLAPAPGDPDGAVSGRVFKIERTHGGERLAYVRLFAGTLRPRQRIRVGDGGEARPTAIKVFGPPGTGRRDTLEPGGMATVRGLGAVRVGDAIGDPPPGETATARFPRPALEAIVAARDPGRQGSLRAALNQLAEQDPLIDIRQDDVRGEISVSLYGDVQKEVIAATLEREYGIEVDYRETTTLCIERPAGPAEAEEILHAPTKTNITGRSSPFSANPFRATLALRIQPGPPGSGVRFEATVEPRLVPLYLFKTPDGFFGQMEAYVHEALADGPSGWPVTDIEVTMTDCGYGAPATTPVDFRRLTQLVIAEALARSGTWVCEPLAELALEMPSSTAPGVLGALGRLGGRLTGQFSAGGLTRAQAVLPVARVRTLQHQLPGLSMGEGLLESRPGGYQPVGEHPPARPRPGPSPLERDAWLAWLARRG